MLVIRAEKGSALSLGGQLVARQADIMGCRCQGDVMLTASICSVHSLANAVCPGNVARGRHVLVGAARALHTVTLTNTHTHTHTHTRTHTCTCPRVII